MRKIVVLLLTLISLAGCGGSDLEAQQVGNNDPSWTPPDPSTLALALQSAVDEKLAQENIPGALIGVFTPNGAWTSATGLADVDAQRPMSLDDSSAWRSITKSLTVTVVLQLVAEGLLQLDAPVATYVDGVPNGGNITLRQLAEMRSGLFSYTKDPDFIQEFSADLTAPWTDQELLSFAFAHPVNFAAGAEYEYSNTNTILLGVVAESVTGQSIQNLIEDRILGPLGLDRSEYMTGTSFPAPFARGYTFDDPNFVELISNASASSSSGAMAGTLADLRTWGAALVAGSLLPPDLHRQRFLSGPVTNGPVYDSYGLGMGEIRGWWGHTGNGLGYEACVFTEPVSGSQIVILVNATNSRADIPADLTETFLDILGWPIP